MNEILGIPIELQYTVLSCIPYSVKINIYLIFQRSMCGKFVALNFLNINETIRELEKLLDRF